MEGLIPATAFTLAAFGLWWLKEWACLRRLPSSPGERFASDRTAAVVAGVVVSLLLLGAWFL